MEKPQLMLLCARCAMERLNFRTRPPRLKNTLDITFRLFWNFGFSNMNFCKRIWTCCGESKAKTPANAKAFQPLSWMICCFGWPTAAFRWTRCNTPHLKPCWDFWTLISVFLLMIPRESYYMHSVLVYWNRFVFSFRLLQFLTALIFFSVS